jgi:hypothetical protein
MTRQWCRACGTPIGQEQATSDDWDDRESLCSACVAALLQPIPYCADDLEDDELEPPG